MEGKRYEKPIGEDFKYKVIVREVSGNVMFGPKGSKYVVKYEIKGDKTDGRYEIYLSDKLAPLRRDYWNNIGFGHNSIEDFIRPLGRDRPKAKREVATIFDIVRKHYPVI